ncbi:MAG TPA: hypothetical protein VGL01_23840, partial [Trinickia sp.]|uniref:hypothetical protein n=1 Tax=Trinickia sp. TaxID=2571163 RepID=UPI002F3E38FC
GLHCHKSSADIPFVAPEELRQHAACYLDNVERLAMISTCVEKKRDRRKAARGATQRTLV